MKFSAKELYTIYFPPLEYVVKVRMDKSQLGKVDATSVKFGNKQLVVYREMKVLVSFASNVANIDSYQGFSEIPLSHLKD